MAAAFTVAILSALLGIVPRAATPEADLPNECAAVDFTLTGHPVLFWFRPGLSIGISAPKQDWQKGESLPLLVWAVNQTDGEQRLLSCSDVEWWTLDLDVYDSRWHRVDDRREPERKSHPESKAGSDIRVCFANKWLLVPPHSCAPLRNNGHDVTSDIAARYDLGPGTYLVTPKKLALPIRGVEITITAAPEKGQHDSPTAVPPAPEQTDGIRLR